jgi:hypothetical protein
MGIVSSPFLLAFEIRSFSGLVRSRESFDARYVSSTIPLGEDGLSARVHLLLPYRLGARCGVICDVLAFRSVAKLWTTQAPSAALCAPKHHLRSLFLWKLWTDFGQRAF